MRYGISALVLFFAFASPMDVAQAAESAPCPPVLFGESGQSGESECVAQPEQPGNSSDTEYGPTQISGGECPRIPKSFPATHLVRSEAEFDSAYSKLQPGEAIVIQDGNYTWNTDRTLAKKGTAEKPIYIVYQTLQRAVFTKNNAEFMITGSHHVIAGLRFNASNDEVFRINGPDNRIACNYFQTSGGQGYIYVTGKGHGDRTEIDNNVFDNHNSTAVRILRCDPQESNCTSNSLGIHIHHNTWKNKAYAGDNGHSAIKLGSGYEAPPGIKTYNADNNNLDAIVENNYFENWDGEKELITVKSDHNIIRNNCIKGSTRSGIVVRAGKNNLITGNWSDSASEGIRISGRGNYYVFNYRRTANGGQMFRLHPGELHEDGSRYVYIDATGNVLRHNVSSSMDRLVETAPRLGGRFIFMTNPTKNVITDNLAFSSSIVGTNAKGSYLNSDGNWSESQFRSNNTWGNNTIVSSDLPSSACGNASLFDGPGGASASISGNPALLGAPTTIKAPSWW